MKYLLACLLVVGLVADSRAQHYRSSWNGALLGGVAGGLIAGRHHTGEGIAIGAASGLILGSLYTAGWDDGGYRRHYSGYRGYSCSTPNYYFYSPYPSPTVAVAPAPLPTIPATQPQPVSEPLPAKPYKAPASGNMEGANALFGR